MVIQTKNLLVLFSY